MHLSPVIAFAQYPTIRVLTRIAEALIWMAFALEFVVMISIVDRKLRYCRQHWVDILVIVLPLIAFLRALRLARLARLNQLVRLTRVYRLRGSVLRAQRGLVVASLVDRLLLRSPEKRLSRLKDLLLEKEREAERLRTRIHQLQSQVDSNGPDSRKAA